MCAYAAVMFQRREVSLLHSPSVSRGLLEVLVPRRDRVSVGGLAVVSPLRENDMKRRAVALVVAAIVVPGCSGGSENTEVQSITTCSEAQPDGLGGYVSECTIEASDSRVEGTETQTGELTFDKGTNERGSFIGTFEIVDEDGSWSGPATGRFGPEELSTQAELTGSGAYEGLVYKFESAFTDFGTAARTGTISTDP
jgi:hypothetical protein